MESRHTDPDPRHPRRQRHLRHLDAAEVAALLTGDATLLSAESRQHLESCPQCAAELERLSAGLAAYRGELLARAERPESYWLAQRRTLRARLDERAERRRILPAWALAASTCALALAVGGGLWWGRGLGPSSRLTSRDAVAPVEIAETATPTPALLATDPDAELLSRVEGAFARRTPEALVPAQALLDELAAPSIGGTS